MVEKESWLRLMEMVDTMVLRAGMLMPAARVAVAKTTFSRPAGHMQVHYLPTIAAKRLENFDMIVLRAGMLLPAARGAVTKTTFSRTARHGLSAAELTRQSHQAKRIVCESARQSQRSQRHFLAMSSAFKSPCQRVAPVRLSARHTEASCCSADCIPQTVQTAAAAAASQEDLREAVASALAPALEQHRTHLFGRGPQ